jgi:hypothetical protein
MKISHLLLFSLLVSGYASAEVVYICKKPNGATIVADEPVRGTTCNAYERVSPSSREVVVVPESPPTVVYSEPPVTYAYPYAVPAFLGGLLLGAYLDGGHYGYWRPYRRYYRPYWHRR